MLEIVNRYFRSRSLPEDTKVPLLQIGKSRSILTGLDRAE